MLNFLASQSAVLVVIIHVGGAILITYLLMLGIHRLMPIELRRQHNEVIGFLIAVMAVFYGLIIASLLVIAINRFDHAEQLTEDESNLVADVVRNARATSPRLDGPVRTLGTRYLDHVIHDEWPAQRRGQKNPTVIPVLVDLFEVVRTYAPRDAREATFYQQLLQAMTRLYDARKERIFIADEGIAETVWIVTLAGSVLTISFSLLFGVESRAMHFMLASFLAVSMALVFALVALFDKPFRGGMAVPDEPYRIVREQIVHYAHAGATDTPSRGED
ncbi:MAG: bestrophin-like domain [Telluria sp.]